MLNTDEETDLKRDDLKSEKSEKVKVEEVLNETGSMRKEDITPHKILASSIDKKEPIHLSGLN